MKKGIYLAWHKVVVFVIFQEQDVYDACVLLHSLSILEYHLSIPEDIIYHVLKSSWYISKSKRHD
jgi:hypothetical protein